jgi:hypothetical protein
MTYQHLSNKYYQEDGVWTQQELTANQLHPPDTERQCSPYWARHAFANLHLSKRIWDDEQDL